MKGPVSANVQKFFRFDVASSNGTLRAGRDEMLTFTFQDENGAPIDIATARFRIPALQSGWSMDVTAKEDADGVLRASLRFPHAGAFVIEPVGVPKNWATRSSFLVDVTP